ncbi:LysR family transcriptional regulator [Rhizobium sp. P38BS-XIX]|uniref:LysR substrate-binding domain-containing protein n=1 Tax=Rhizobium sp. P38BS-XIX TaxID=2726740 RepID=UPI00145716B4|nr:LysR substrate-binding domain-containing protein [Rhizobium sp. P38BS-XIX]NLR97430.1 LysR family transcriptional regulator [Rhizobium sp. P38BS-XIX]
MNLQPHSHLTGITAFVVTVELGSFTAAAGKMGLSKSAVAKNLSRLEERLGTRLLDRTTRRLGLTADGRAYHETCLRVLSELDSAEALLASRQRVASGTLRVSLPATFGPRWVVPMLAEALKRYPQLTLDASFSDRHVDLIDEGFDLAVRIGELEDSASLMARKIGTQTSQVCASPEYLARHGRPQRPGDIMEHDCLGETRGGKILPWFLQDKDSETVRVDISPRHIITNGDALLNAAVAGAGLACLPTWLVSADLRAGRLQEVLATSATNDRPIHLVWPRARDILPKVRVVVDELAGRFLPSPPWVEAGLVRPADPTSR